MRIASLAVGLIPFAAWGQGASEFVLGAGPPPPLDRPRAVEVFEDVDPYWGLTPDRYGTPAQPFANELGLFFVLRTFRKICLTLEQGSKLEEALPEGFAPYGLSSHFYGKRTKEKSDWTVLSSTGSDEVDEIEGRPVIHLDPRPHGMTCRLEWRIAEDIPANRQEVMARLIKEWLPWEMALVQASRPDMSAELQTSGFHQWDRPCLGRWCAVTALFDLGDGRVSLETTLNITDIGGTRP